jgi:hypothetical protein
MLDDSSILWHEDPSWQPRCGRIPHGPAATGARTLHSPAFVELPQPFRKRGVFITSGATRHEHGTWPRRHSHDTEVSDALDGLTTPKLDSEGQRRVADDVVGTVVALGRRPPCVWQRAPDAGRAVERPDRRS